MIYRVCLLLVLALGSAQAGAESAGENWVTSWGAAAQLTEPHNLPPAPLAGQTLRQFLRPSLGGKDLRLQVSNEFGDAPLVLEAASIALAAGSGSAGDGEIDPASSQPLSFSGSPTVSIAPGITVYSDPVEFALAPFSVVAVSMQVAASSDTAVTGHPGSRTTSFIQPGDATLLAALPEAARTTHWYLLTRLEVAADPRAAALVVLGDSLSDGRGSTTDGNDRWPDQLAQRLVEQPATAQVVVVNMGIGGNAVFGGLGPAAVDRFSRDVLQVRGARWLIIFEGVNDIGTASEADAPGLVPRLIAAYTDFAAQAHAGGLQVYGATITPFGGSFYDSPAREAARMAVNAWIRDNEVLDAVIDFDAVVRDPENPNRLLPAYDTGDQLHLNPEGYRAMAEGVDLGLFESR